MSADRELLELAARAEGHGVEFDELSGLIWYEDKYTSILWNPIHNDGDALRLAVACNISYGFGSDTERMRVVWFVNDSLCTLDMPEDHPMALPDNKTEWLRYAIVRAAAEIGRSMPYPNNSIKRNQIDAISFKLDDQALNDHDAIIQCIDTVSCCSTP